MVIITILLGVLFILLGSAKAFQFNFQVEDWEEYGYPQWLMGAIGVIEIVCGIIFLVAMLFPSLAFVAGIVIAILLLLAIYTRFIRLKHPWSKVLLHSILLIVIVVMMFSL